MQTSSPTPSRNRREQGVALVITLGILAVLVILAVAFMLNSRNEIVSAAYYRDMVAAKSFAKMGFDRALMELSYLDVLSPATGTNSGVYALSDLMRADNFVFSTGCVGTASRPVGDFVNRDTNPCQSDGEPYWIEIKDAAGNRVGRFAYIAYGGLVDINAIGNIAGASDTFIRTGGNLGVSNTWANASDVSLADFLNKLRYTLPDESARRILAYRYGWNSVGSPALGLHKPGASGTDDDGDGVADNPAEYNPVTPIADDQRIGDLAQLDNGNPPWPNTAPIAPDATGSIYLKEYATTDSGESNLTNQLGVARYNINTNLPPLGVVDAFLYTNTVPLLANAIRPYLSNSNQVWQLAVNLIDFRTTNRYPTVFTTNLAPVRTFIGIKQTPYLNQILLSNIVIQTRLIGPGPASNHTYGVSFITFAGVELWNPYTAFADPCTVITTNQWRYTIGGNTPTLYTWIATNVFAPPPSGYSVTYTNNSAAGLAGTRPSITIVSNSTWAPPSLTVTQVMAGASHFGNLNRTNLINLIGQRIITNVVSVALDWSAVPTNIIRTNIVFYTNFEADDPRMNVLYLQTNGAPNFTLGSANVNTYQPTASTTVPGSYPRADNPFTASVLESASTNSGPREGVASFFVKRSNYISIGEIGLVHRGEPWSTIRLQPWPVDENRLLDVIRVTNHQTVRGRISLNSDISFPPGVTTNNYDGPAFHALLGGLTNAAYTGGTITDTKIKAIIKDLDDYRQTVLGGQIYDSINHIGELKTLTTDLSNGIIPYDKDYEREQILRDIANLVTVSRGGSSEIVAWGQVMKGNGTVPGGTVLGALVVIRAKFDRNAGPGGKIKLTKFQYITP